MIREMILAGLAGALRETGHPVIIVSDERVGRQDLVILGRPEPVAREVPVSVMPWRPRVDPDADSARQLSAAQAKRARKNARRLSSTYQP